MLFVSGPKHSPSAANVKVREPAIIVVNDRLLPKYGRYDGGLRALPSRQHPESLQEP